MRSGVFDPPSLFWRLDSSLWRRIADEKVEDIDVLQRVRSWWWCRCAGRDVNHSNGIHVVAFWRILNICTARNHAAAVVRRFALVVLLILLFVAFRRFVLVEVTLVLLRFADTGRMGAVVCAVKVHHTIETGICCAVALVAMRVQLLLGEHVAARLHEVNRLAEDWSRFEPQNKTYLAAEGDHAADIRA